MLSELSAESLSDHFILDFSKEGHNFDNKIFIKQPTTILFPITSKVSLKKIVILNGESKKEEMYELVIC